MPAPAATSRPAEFQSRQRPRARSELVGFDAKALEHAHEKIAQRRRVLRIEGEMLAVLEAAAGEEHRTTSWSLLNPDYRSAKSAGDQAPRPGGQYDANWKAGSQVR